MYYTRATILLALSGVFFASVPAIAQDETDQSIGFVNNENNPDALNFTFGVPDSPALALAGLEASGTTTINQLNDFSISIPSVSSGEQAVALDINPANVLFPIPTYEKTLTNYQNRGYLYRLLRRTRISALGRAGNENMDDPSESVRSLLGGGISASLFDGSDPLTASVNEFDNCMAFTNGLKQSVRGAALEPNALAAIGLISEINDHLTNNRLSEARQKLIEARAHIAIIDNDDVTNASKEELEGFVHKLYNSALELRTDSGADNALVEARKTCYEAIGNALLRRPNLDVGGAVLWRGDTSSFSDFESGGGALWVSYRHPIPFGGENSKQHLILGGTGRLGFDEFSSTGNEETPEAKADTYQVWGGLELVSKYWNLGAQIGYVEVDFNAAETQEFSRSGERWLVSSEISLSRLSEKLPSNIWVIVSYGDAQGTVEALEGDRFTVALRFNGAKGLKVFE